MIVLHVCNVIGIFSPQIALVCDTANFFFFFLPFFLIYKDSNNQIYFFYLNILLLYIYIFILFTCMSN